ncbi:MAG: MFS transporter, partial [Thermoplasmataceae archaeon]
IGRKTLLTVSIIGFTIFSAAIGIIPPYSQIGIFSPILLYIVLFIVGFFAGAEYGGGAALALESVPENKREPVGAFMQSGYGTGYFLVVYVAILLSGYLGHSFVTIGWRYLFLTSLVPGALTFVIRAASKETKVFNKMKENREIENSPAVSMIKGSSVKLLYGLMITTGILFLNTATFSFYPILGSASSPYFLNIGSHLLDALLVINFVSLIGVWFGGYIARKQKSRRIPMLMFSIIFTVPSAAFVFFGFTSDWVVFTIVFSVQAFLEAMIFSTLPSFLSETFSKRYRSTAIGVVYNGGAIIGGTALLLLAAPASLVSLKLLWIVELYAASVLLISGLVLSRSYEKHMEGDMINQ